MDRSIFGSSGTTKRRPVILFTGVQRLARELNLYGLVAACLWNPKEQVCSAHEIPIWIPYEPSDLPSLKAMLLKWRRRDDIRGIINRRETRVVEHAFLNHVLGFDGLTLRQARIMRDKFLLREALKNKAPHLNPPYDLVDLEAPRRPKVPTPFLFKPRNLFKSQLIELCHDSDQIPELSSTLLKRLPSAGKRHGVQVYTQFLTEHYVSGKQVSVDVFVTDTGTLTFSPPVTIIPASQWAMDDLHVALRKIPAHLESHQERALTEAVSGLVEALELRWVPMHVDLVLHHRRWLVLDAGPRIGGYRSEMMDLAYGCALDPMNLKLAMGDVPNWDPKWQRSVAVLELFPKRKGIFKGIQGLDAMKGLPSFHRLRIRASKGAKIGLSRDGFRCPLFVVMCHEDEGVLEEDIEFIRRNVIIEVST